MKTQEEQFTKVVGIIHDPFEAINKNLKSNLFSSLEICDNATALEEDNQAFSKKIIQYSARNYRSSSGLSLRGDA